MAEYDSEPDCIAHRVTVWGSALLRATDNRSIPKSHWAPRDTVVSRAKFTAKRGTTYRVSLRESLNFKRPL
ncbi:hypothetical protein PV325_013793 [Microctonus aethiopoides]|nr:hypothetical protein PV325_013793 [Microctonus aethiopoides]